MAQVNGTSDGAYSLPRGTSESSRLDEQHHLLTANAGFVLHPRIRKALPADARIADVATGTGIWLNSLAADAPSGWTYHGFDISDAQFPPPEQRGRRSFHTLNILGDIPAEFEAKYDAVHIRYLICALPGDTWNTVARNCLRMLKPGGWLQWHESDFGHMTSVQTLPEASMKATRDLLLTFLGLQQKTGKYLADQVYPGLNKAVQSAGFTDIDETIMASDRLPETREGITQACNGAVYGGARLLTQRDPSCGVPTEAVDALYQKSLEELKDGKVYYRFDMHYVTGQRPA